MNTVHFKPPRPNEKLNMFNFSSWRFEMNRVHSRRYQPVVARCYHGRFYFRQRLTEHGPFQAATKNQTWLIFLAVRRNGTAEK